MRPLPAGRYVANIPSGFFWHMVSTSDVYYGLSETIDDDNLNHSDKAFVFTETIPSIASTAAEYASQIADS